MKKELNQNQWAKLHQLQNGLVEKMINLVSEEVAKVRKQRKISGFTLDAKEEEVLSEVEKTITKVVTGMESLVEDFKKKSFEITKEEVGG